MIRKHWQLCFVALTIIFIKLSNVFVYSNFYTSIRYVIRIFLILILILIPLQGFWRSNFNESSRRKARPHNLLFLATHMVTGNHFVTKYMAIYHLGDFLHVSVNCNINIYIYGKWQPPFSQFFLSSFINCIRLCLLSHPIQILGTQLLGVQRTFLYLLDDRSS